MVIIIFLISLRDFLAIIRKISFKCNSYSFNELLLPYHSPQLFDTRLASDHLDDAVFEEGEEAVCSHVLHDDTGVSRDAVDDLLSDRISNLHDFQECKSADVAGLVAVITTRITRYIPISSQTQIGSGIFYLGEHLGDKSCFLFVGDTLGHTVRTAFADKSLSDDELECWS